MFLSLSFIFAEEIAIGYINIAKISKECKVFKEINEHTQKLIDAFNIYTDLKTKKLEYASPEKQEIINKEINERKINLDFAINLNNQKLKSCVNVANNMVKEIAAEHGLQLVLLDTNSIIVPNTMAYADITDETIKRMDKLNEK